MVVDSDTIPAVYDGREDRARIEVRQTVDGVPLASRLLLAVGRNGEVQSLSGTLMHLDMFDRPQSELLGREEAIRLAVDFATEKYAIDWPLGRSAAELLYELANDVSSANLVWRVTIGTNCSLEYRVDIRAASGEVTENLERVTGVSFSMPEREVLRENCRTTNAAL